ncbi:uncharacterized protein EV420DRAFT_1643069 [Desarmillaria tabescens]|uniref:Uncharacterized protein n=1 Tax=Armillaria tabescens TaxID=1929756 RepID=A0AA39N4U5_ARMTA|nr:uncharacterized protein EV420DRAFT_1643069 [Desarmillaria tabescens]KAK0458191.1 hypothetical protein EV420DRAFT_1643069 [Desarmillaria tabescens]
MCLATRDRCLTSLAAAKPVPLPRTGDDLYQPGTILQLKFQSHEFADYKDLSATVIKRFEPVTSAVVLLVQRHSDNEQRYIGVPWTSSIEDHLRRAIRDIQAGVIPDWFELINDRENRPDPELWEDWMWEVLTWLSKMSNYNTELTAYRLLHRLQGRYIPRLFGVVRLRITPECAPLHPITDVVEGLVLEYIPGVSMETLKPTRLSFTGLLCLK